MVRRAAVMVLLLCCGLARAQSDDALARARSHFEAGRALYNLKQYTDAIREFSAGYQLVPKPQFLVNLAQCYEHLAEGASDTAGKREGLEHARDMYEKYLADAPANDPLREQAKGMLAEMNRRISALPPPASATSTEPAQTTAPPPTTAPPATTTAANPAVVSTTSSQDVEVHKKKSGIARYWWIIPVAAVVVVGVSLGAYYGTRPTGPDCGSATFGCVDASKMSLIHY